MSRIVFLRLCLLSDVPEFLPGDDRDTKNGAFALVRREIDASGEEGGHGKEAW